MFFLWAVKTPEEARVQASVTFLLAEATYLTKATSGRFILAHISRGRRSRWQLVTLCPLSGSSVQEVGLACTRRSISSSSCKAPPLKGFTAFPTSVSRWEPSVRAWELVGDTPDSQTTRQKGIWGALSQWEGSGRACRWQGRA